MQLRDEWRLVRVPEAKEFGRREYEAARQLRVAEVTDMDNVGHA